MKTAPFDDERREYPHLVSKGMRRNCRTALVVSNRPAATGGRSDVEEFRGPGMVASDGVITAKARDVIVARFSRLAATSKARYCVVWSPSSCTWFDPDGRHRDGVSPPQGDVGDPWINADHPAPVEWCWTIELPKGGEWTHLCVRRLDRDFVEIAPGEAMTLASFDEPVLPGRPDPALALLDADGRIVPPRRYRGQPVTGLRDANHLLGPVQPADDGIVLRNAWPDDVRDACERVAGMELPVELTDAAWRVLDPDATDVTWVGILKAA